MSYVNDPKRHVKRFEVPEEVARSVNGQPAWVDIKTRIKGKHVRALQEAISTLTEIASINTDNLTEAQTVKLVQKAQEATYNANRIFEIFATMVIDWNWLDEETGQPLPKPTAQVIEDELDQIQTVYIRDRIREIQKYRVTEGNASSGSPS